MGISEAQDPQTRPWIQALGCTNRAKNKAAGSENQLFTSWPSASLRLELSGPQIYSKQKTILACIHAYSWCMVTIAGTSLHFAVHSRFQRKTYLNEKLDQPYLQEKNKTKLSPGATPTERIKCDLNRWLSQIFQVLPFIAVRTLFGVTQLRRLWLRYDRQWVKWRLKVPELYIRSSSPSCQ